MGRNIKLAIYLFLGTFSFTQCVFALSLCVAPFNPSTWSNCYGVLQSSSGVYEGTFRNGQFDGEGEFTFKNGEKYIGQFRKGMRHGMGVNKYSGGQVYKGQFKNNELTGHGIMIWVDYGEYEGEFKNGILDGYGVRKYPNGDKFEGEFKANRKHGMGVYFYADGGVLEGLWDTGEFVSSKKREDNGGNTKRDWSGEYLNVSSGTGFYISKYGHIITNHHVTQGCNKVKVHIGGKVFEAVKIADDEVNDLALIKIDQSPNQFFALSTTNPYPTQEILVAGFPFGEYISSTLKFTQGIISSLAGIKNNYGQIQIDAALQPGNSGGPIIDNRGNVVGVAVSKLSLERVLEDYGVIPENINFGVKASVVKNFLESNSVELKRPKDGAISRKELSLMVAESTTFLSCWMTEEEIKKIKSSKVLFRHIYD